MVRARVREHLEALIERFAGELGGCEIKASPGTDYAYRIFVPKSDWANVRTGLGDDLDYDNFKSAVARHQGHNQYEHALHDVWQVMYGMQKYNSRLSSKGER